MQKQDISANTIRKGVDSSAQGGLYSIAEMGLELCRLVQEFDCCSKIAVPEPGGVRLQASVPPA